MNDRFGVICILPYNFYNLISPFFFSNFCLGFVILSAFVRHFTPLCVCCILFLPPLSDHLCGGFLTPSHMMLLTKQGLYDSISNCFFKSCDVSRVKKRFRLIWCLYMTISVRASLMMGHCPSQRVPRPSADAFYSGGDTRRDSTGR